MGKGGGELQEVMRDNRFRRGGGKEGTSHRDGRLRKTFIDLKISNCRERNAFRQSAIMGRTWDGRALT